ncbi:MULTISPECIES: helix-turn-helix domain-containing protein [Bacillus cereus group]|uniref:helix-turn-helix domain-containing protein n=1 Tax=Bacillus cereus group TaxID=86661 RepID=UPI000D86B4B7|nr:helix-turn-helix domain-containing protein [Bacillus cereus]SPT76085.1 capsule synthesis trans-acting positive regulator AcpB [Bacillus cereus]
MLIKRQYNILNHLVSEDRWFPMNELSQKLNCSVKTVQRDLVYLQKNLPDKWYLKNNKHTGVRLYKPFNSSIENINYLYIRHTLLFKTLDILMNNNVGSNSVLAEKLYIQNKKVKKNLKEVELYLNQYKLSLKRRPLRISGNNMSILLMYHKLYLDAYNDEEWPFKDFNQEPYIEFFKEVEKFKKSKYCKEATKEISFFIALYLKRKYRGYSILLKHWQIKQIEKSNDYIHLKGVIQKIFQTYNVQLSTVDITFIISIINHSKYTCTKQSYIKSIQSVTKPTCPFVEQFIRDLEKAFKLELLNDTKFIKVLNKILTPFNKIDDWIFSNHNNNHPLITYIKKSHSSIFFIISKELTNLKNTYDKFNIPLNISIHNIILLTMYIATKKMDLKRKNPQVILYTKEGEYWKLYLQVFFSLTFKKTFDFLDISLENITQIHIEYSNISCIITDTSVECEHIPVILISSVPTQRNLEEIQKFL